MAGLFFSEDLVTILDKPGDFAAVEKSMADRMFEVGVVKDTYAGAIAEREKGFPTALAVGEVNVAIPHCDVVNVNKAAMCMGVLANPVDWHKMDEPDETCKVSVVCMLALTEAHAHLEMLQKVIAFVQDQELVGKVIAAQDADEVFSLAGSLLV